VLTDSVCVGVDGEATTAAAADPACAVSTLIGFGTEWPLGRDADGSVAVVAALFLLAALVLVAGGARTHDVLLANSWLLGMGDGINELLGLGNGAVGWPSESPRRICCVSDGLASVSDAIIKAQIWIHRRA
jgi:hypothetical protein